MRAIDLHAEEEVIFEGHPSWRAMLAFYIQGLLAVLVVGAIVAGVTALGNGVKWGLVAAVVVVGAALLIVGGLIARIATVYTITNQRLRIKRGILSKKVQQTRIDRVQNVNTNQSVLERVLRVGTVDFDTAGTDDSDFTFAGVSSPARVVEAVDRAQHAAAAAEPDEPGL
ncbi:MAG: hypothetical protein QOK00_2713 [Thermoleophilaceae bacterium]|nr:hypothetical protein [Thermoleophilaceae bacterium]